MFKTVYNKNKLLPIYGAFKHVDMNAHPGLKLPFHTTIYKTNYTKYGYYFCLELNDYHDSYTIKDINNKDVFDFNITEIIFIFKAGYSNTFISLTKYLNDDKFTEIIDGTSYILLKDKSTELYNVYNVYFEKIFKEQIEFNENKFISSDDITFTIDKDLTIYINDVSIIELYNKNKHLRQTYISLVNKYLYFSADEYFENSNEDNIESLVIKTNVINNKIDDIYCILEQILNKLNKE